MTNHGRHLGRLFIFLMVFGAASLQAEMSLENKRSTIQFMSVKNTSIAELHHFRVLSGQLADDGTASVRIDLDSVETLIPIRNQRLREILFETVRFPHATLTANAPASVLALSAGQSVTETLSIEVNLHGSAKSVDATVLATRLDNGGLQVVLASPILVQAADFGLDGGLGVLQEVAGLVSISTTVPVTGTLIFMPAS